MAGGKKRGQLVFWTVFFLCVLFALWFFAYMSAPAYDSMAEFLGHFNININQIEVNIPSTIFRNLLFALLIAIIEFVALIGFAGILGAFVGTFLSFLLSPFTTRRIDNVFNELLPIIEKSNELNHSNETAQLLSDAKKLYERWNKSRFTRITRRTTQKRTRELYDRRQL